MVRPRGKEIGAVRAQEHRGELQGKRRGRCAIARSRRNPQSQQWLWRAEGMDEQIAELKKRVPELGRLARASEAMRT